jgi:predicted DNA repair protein MutK
MLNLMLVYSRLGIEMAGASLLTLLDDITTVLDDVAVMSKIAAKKTAGVLGDDLALNAEQVSGVAAEREIPVVIAVAKGSLRNKLILVPVALLLSSFASWMIKPLLIIGGLYLCFEGAEKILAPWLHPGDESDSDSDQHEFNQASDQTPQAYEQRKIKGAIRTDFILSAEIIVIALGTVQGAELIDQIMVVSFIAFVMTIGVYGLVAGIVKLDDLGFYLEKRSKGAGPLMRIGQALITFAPKLMKTLTIVGTAAMFLVGGGIIVHNVAFIHHDVFSLLEPFVNIEILGTTLPIIVNGVIGVLSGAVLAVIGHVIEKVRH